MLDERTKGRIRVRARQYAMSVPKHGGVYIVYDVDENDEWWALMFEELKEVHGIESCKVGEKMFLLPIGISEARKADLIRKYGKTGLPRDERVVLRPSDR